VNCEGGRRRGREKERRLSKGFYNFISETPTPVSVEVELSFRLSGFETFDNFISVAKDLTNISLYLLLIRSRNT
jgi:hypothetical protein